MKKTANNLRISILSLSFVILVSLPVIWPLFKPGLMVTDDLGWMVIRFSAFHQTLREGQFPVRFLGRLNFGYGYPVANFLYPGFMYLAEPIHLLGFGFSTSIKIIVGLSIVSSSIFTYLWLSKLFTKFASLFGALGYLYAPYHLYDFYKRGSVGELLAFAVVPFIFWQIERGSLFWSSIGLALLILSHNTLAVLFLPVIVIYYFIKLFDKSKSHFIFDSLSFILIPLALSAFFWVPALFELRFTLFSMTVVSEWSNYFTDTAFSGYGLLTISGVLAYVLISFKLWKRGQHKNYTILFLGIGALGILLSHKYSIIIWYLLPVAFVQFPFRFLSLLVLSAAFLTAYLLSLQKEFTRYVLALVLMIVLVLNALPFMKVAGFLVQEDSLYSTNEDTTTVKNEYMPRWVKSTPVAHPEQKIEGISYRDLTISSKKISFTALISGTAIIHTVYYPGWEAYLDGKKSSMKYQDKRGLMVLDIKSAPLKAELIFHETPLRRIANIISLITFVILLVYTLHKARKYSG